MKTCPCCNSRTFDDMDTCYVCMHRFPVDENSVSPNSGNTRDAQAVASEPLPKSVALSSLGDVENSSLEELLEGVSDEAAGPTVTTSPISKDDAVCMSSSAGSGSDVGGTVFSAAQSDTVVSQPGTDDATAIWKTQRSATSWNYTDTICEDAMVPARSDQQQPSGPTSWNLEIELNGFPGYSRELASEGDRITIGRATSNDIIVPDLRVSRKHAEMFVSQHRLWVVDCGSKNMTMLDGVPVVGTKEVSGNAALQMGSARIHVQPVKA